MMTQYQMTYKTQLDSQKLTQNLNLTLQPLDLNRPLDDDLLVQVLDSFETQLQPTTMTSTTTTNIRNVQNVQNIKPVEAMVPKMYFGNSTITINYNFRK